jgi:DNA (cytosine-5)-methyltransferase 1
MEAGHLDAAPIWTDVKTFPYREFCGKVDILSGGYPCQPFSTAGKRLGADDPRHLWPFIADGIAAMRPEWCFFENVEGHISLGLSNVIEDLAGMGYRTAWGIFSAAEVGAPHQRKRVFILAHCDGVGGRGWHAKWKNAMDAQSGCSEWLCDKSVLSRWPSRPGEPQFGWEPPRVVADASEQHGQWRSARTGWGSGSEIDATGGDAAEQRQAEPALGRDLDGPAGGLGYAELCVACDNRTDELRLLGNGVVPATAERAFTTLLQRLLK